MSWRPALRIARRDALRARGRSALVVAMVALPVLGIGTGAVLLRTAQLDPDERAERELGRTQARLTLVGRGARVLQAPDPDQGGAIVDAAGAGAPAPSDVPPGYRALVSREDTLLFASRGGEAPLRVHEIDVGDRAFAGRFRLRDGRAPRTRGEVAVTRAALERLGSAVGGTTALVVPERALRVVGVVEEVGAGGEETVWAPPGTLLPPADAETGPAASVYLADGPPLTWPDVLRLNAAGIVVLSRAVLLDPPPRSEVPYYAQGLAAGERQRRLAAVLAAVLVVSLALLEVILLAGAAFAVGARRQARSLGLVGAAGGEARDVRRIVLAGGAVLGSAGAAVGVALAVPLAVLAVPLLERWTGSEFGRLDVRPLELGVAALVGLAAALLAAALPARGAARRDPVEALTGRRGQVRTPRKVPVIGVAIACAGAGTAALGSLAAIARADPLLAAGLVAAGAGLAQLGLIVCTPAIVGLAGRRSRRLPLPLRLALTDASRHRGRSAPAVAAVLAAVAGASAVALVVASFDERDRRNYRPQLPAGSGSIALEPLPLPGGGGGGRRALLDPARVAAAVRSELPPFTAHALRATPMACGPDTSCRTAAPVLPAESLCPGPLELDAGDARCDPTLGYGGGLLPATPVGDAGLVRALAGRAPAAAAEVLAAGGAVVFDRRYVVDGELAVELSSGGGGASTTVRLPAVALDVADPPVLAVYGERAAERLGLRTAETTLLLTFERVPTTAEEDAARAALRLSGLDAPFAVERGYRGDYGLGLLALVAAAAVITLGAAGVATGLAQADARADHATLAAVGATPGLRRTLAAAQALAVAALGTLLGVLAGLVPSLAFIAAIDSLRLVVPWTTLAQVLLGIPLVAAGCAWLLTRSRLPLERRVAA